jgi:hypothetical protein
MRRVITAAVPFAAAVEARSDNLAAAVQAAYLSWLKHVCLQHLALLGKAITTVPAEE